MTELEKFVHARAVAIALRQIERGADSSPETCLLLYLEENAYIELHDPAMLDAACAAMLPWFIRAIEPVAAA
jgi:hypothetical protein